MDYPPVPRLANLAGPYIGRDGGDRADLAASFRNGSLPKGNKVYHYLSTRGHSALFDFSPCYLSTLMTDVGVRWNARLEWYSGRHGFEPLARLSNIEEKNSKHTQPYLFRISPWLGRYLGRESQDSFP